MYLGTFIYTLGLAMVASDLLAFIFFMFSIWVNYKKIPDEEQMMIDEFGEEYFEYMKHTGKILQRV